MSGTPHAPKGTGAQATVNADSNPHPAAGTFSGEVDDDTAVELWGRIIRGFHFTNRLLQERTRAEFDLSDAEAETLLTLHRRPEHRARLSALSKAAAFSTGGFTKIADKLVARGLAERSGCSEDRRVIYLQLTKIGAELAAKLTTFVAESNRSYVIDVLGVERTRALADAMSDLYRANHR
ncbi:MAG: MarR family winged helix-turn-helix transcriptional regulator [Leucobacter sp.]